MKKSKILIVILLLLPAIIFAQNKSIHQEQSEYYKNYKLESEQAWDEQNNFKAKNTSPIKITNKSLEKEVFGWNPYWLGTSYYDYDYSLLSEVSYFSCEVNAATGEPNDVHYWLTTEIVDYAHAAGTRISLTATLFSNHQTLFDNPASVQTLIDTLVGLVKYRDADGINIDFEAVSSTQREKMTTFMIDLSNRFHSEIPGSTVSIALPAVDWSSTFDVATMNDYVDIFLIMGYGYHWSGGSTAGPVSPKNSGDIWTDIDVTQSINSYIEDGVSPEKLCLAVPYYGRDWATENGNIPSSATATGVAVTYKDVRNDYSNYTKTWDNHSSTPAYIYEDASSWHQCWFDNEESMGEKYDMINAQDIGGIGIWALGYDGSYTELYDIISEKFSTEGNNQCSGTFSDMGGAMGNYYNNENYTFTIAPNGAEQIELIFEDFFVEQDYDTLFIYNGQDTNSPLINYYTGEHFINQPIIANSGAVTFKFFSDVGVNEEGWNINWTCGSFSDIQEDTNQNNIRIYPNPFYKKSDIQIILLKQSQVEIKILDIKGQIISKKILFLQSGKNTVPLSSLTTNLKTGTYFVSIKTDENIFYKKLIKI